MKNHNNPATQSKKEIPLIRLKKAYREMEYVFIGTFLSACGMSRIYGVDPYSSVIVGVISALIVDISLRTFTLPPVFYWRVVLDYFLLVASVSAGFYIHGFPCVLISVFIASAVILWIVLFRRILPAI